jgi:hypothetical protein
LPNKVVVVVLPLLPVTPMIEAGQTSKNRSVSAETGMPRPWASRA